MDIVNYSKLDVKCTKTIEVIESKPHVRFIRYLLTKRYSPAAIKKELFRLGLSAPHEPSLAAYYLLVIDPLIKKFGLSEYYSDYKNKLLRKENDKRDFKKQILNFKFDLGDDLDGQVRFLGFCKYIEIDDLWLREFYNFYGSTDRFPLDTEGNKIIIIDAPKKNAEKILTHPKRYLIDKMILENLPNSRISKYCREQFKIPVNDYDIRAYKTSFFNIKTQNLEDKIKTLNAEKNSLDSLLQDLDNDSFDMELGESMLIKKQTEQRKTELEDNLKTLNSIYSDIAFRQASNNVNDCEQMFLDVINRGYTRFCDLDKERDRDVVDPLFKVAKMMSFAHDKVENIRITGENKTPTDMHSQAEMLQLYKKRVDEVFDEEVGRAEKTIGDTLNSHINPDEIMGLEELGISYETDSDDED